jgi:hypothetical protein
VQVQPQGQIQIHTSYYTHAHQSAAILTAAKVLKNFLQTRAGKERSHGPALPGCACYTGASRHSLSPCSRYCCHKSTLLGRHQGACMLSLTAVSNRKYCYSSRARCLKNNKKTHAVVPASSIHLRAHVVLQQQLQMQQPSRCCIHMHRQMQLQRTSYGTSARSMPGHAEVGS